MSGGGCSVARTRHAGKHGCPARPEPTPGAHPGPHHDRTPPVEPGTHRARPSPPAHPSLTGIYSGSTYRPRFHTKFEIIWTLIPCSTYSSRLAALPWGLAHILPGRLRTHGRSPPRSPPRTKFRVYRIVFQPFLCTYAKSGHANWSSHRISAVRGRAQPSFGVWEDCGRAYVAMCARGTTARARARSTRVNRANMANNFVPRDSYHDLPLIITTGTTPKYCEFSHAGVVGGPDM